MDTNTLPEGLLEKMQKLLNLQEGAEAVGNLHEAEAAASRLHTLLMKHNLDMETVKSHTIAQKAKMSNQDVFTGEMADKREADWVTKLYSGVANANLCKVFSSKGYVRIFGHADNVALVLYISEQLVAKVRIAEKYAWKEYTGNEKRGTYRRGFFEGAAYGIAARLREDMAAYKDPANNNPYAVMVVNKEKEVDEYLWELFPHMKPESVQERSDRLARQENEEKERIAKMSAEELKAYNKQKNKKTPIRYRKGPRGLSSNDGYSQGHETGRKMNINKGMDNSSAKANIN